MSRLLRADRVSTTQDITAAWKVHQRAEAKTGDVAIATFAYGQITTSITAPDGTWTAFPVLAQSTAVYLASFYKTLTADGAADYTFGGFANRPLAAHCAVVAGGAPVAATTTGVGTVVTAPTVTPANAGSLVLATACSARPSNSWADIPATGSGWKRRCSALSGDTFPNSTYAWLGVYAIDDAPATAAPALTWTLPASGHWAAQTLVFPPNAQPAATLLSDVWAPHPITGLWAPISELAPVSGSWV